MYFSIDKTVLLSSDCLEYVAILKRKKDHVISCQGIKSGPVIKIEAVPHVRNGSCTTSVRATIDTEPGFRLEPRSHPVGFNWFQIPSKKTRSQVPNVKMGSFHR